MGKEDKAAKAIMLALTKYFEDHPEGEIPAVAEVLNSESKPIMVKLDKEDMSKLRSRKTNP